MVSVTGSVATVVSAAVVPVTLCYTSLCSGCSVEVSCCSVVGDCGVCVGDSGYDETGESVCDPDCTVQISDCNCVVCDCRTVDTLYEPWMLSMTSCGESVVSEDGTCLSDCMVSVPSVCEVECSLDWTDDSYVSVSLDAGGSVH